MNKAREVIDLLTEKEVKEEGGLGKLDKKMIDQGKKFKIILPKGKGEALYTKSMDAAKEMAKEYGKGTLVLDL